MVRYLNLKSRERSEMIDITERIEEMIDNLRVASGCCDLFVMHTTAGLTVNEGADPAVKRDIISFLDRAVPHNSPYFTHAEGNAAAHVKASIMGSSLRLFIDKGKLLLGTWQAVYFCEFDGPRDRKVAIRIVTEPSV
ncbi:secondary thiamine-phosphate synthase enzyme YjbQ [Geomesophilobacter sediminis]|uniref:YjbQ family protein n=1 Tax=Geomesophilobacter sediminis TaxID=2798584 RepID=A0A8J7M3G5_9BACT|nr:secondary thiamine-phosphate synthase enzyme YjbQ [Geomesophilobacter sediminis]MBJ6727884.1 YjbQ family protein [Geomesophilobacter sediminis]